MFLFYMVLKGTDHSSISRQFVQTKKRMQDLQPEVTLFLVGVCSSFKIHQL